MSLIQSYIDNLNNELKTGIAAEHSYRPALKSLFETFDDTVNAINDPKRSEVGAPDFVIVRGGVPVGIMETKNIGISLNAAENTDQMERYLKLPNVILTDYLEFRWYVDGKHHDTVTVGQLANGKIVGETEAYSQLETLLGSYTQNVTPIIRSSQELAVRMAHLAQLIRDYIIADMESDSPSEQLTGQMKAFKKTLLPDIDIADFADMYAQTIVYGMFVGRVYFPNDPTTFRRTSAAHHIPQTNPFLRKLFYNINFDIGPRVTWVVDKLADLLAHTDTNRILEDFGQATRQEDPVVHFYEDFLQEYDPAKREQRGVYYTPEPVVSYIVRSVDHILRETFGKKGLADKEVMILDPATGTGTFLYFVIEEIRKQLQQFPAMWDGYVQQKLLPRIFGFELMMAPYTVAHMKLGLQLREMGYDFPDNERLGIYLTNTLEEAVKQEEMLLAQFITDEANEAAAIKRQKPIMVVLGNPPYSGHSANTGDWITRLHRDYYKVDGKPLGERNPKWLQNDYVKFIRFGQWRIEQTGSGVLAFITDNSYLDSVTFRGMRQSLMNTFTDIYILDLHGNSKKQETAPDGSRDDNVFDITQGVAVALFVKEEGETGAANIHHVDLYGKRSHKYSWLEKHDIKSTGWDKIEPQNPYYFFVPKDLELAPEYKQGIQVNELFPVNSMAITTGNDGERVRFQIGDLKSYDEKKITEYAYRVFDTRFTVYDNDFLVRARTEVMDHLYQKPNLALITLRKPRNEYVENFFVSEKVTDKCYISSLDNAYAFPLWEYPEKDEGTLFEVEDDGSAWQLSAEGRRPNLDKAFVQHVTQKLARRFVYDDITTEVGSGEDTVTPEALFHYAYAVFHSPAYRERYAEFLKIDFPRLPVTSDASLFDALAETGAALVDLHLMRDASLQTDVGFENDPDTESSLKVVSRHPRYDADNERVYINKTTYFSNVPPDVWEFHIGGYQVLHKWLKDRKKRELDVDEVQHYARVVAALQHTMRLMDEIDALIPDWPIK